MDLYEIVKALHNIVRWIVLVVGFLAVLRAYIGYFRKLDWIPADRSIGSAFAGSLDLQLLLGLILYLFLSPITTPALQNFGQAMSSRDLMFFVIEHPVTMIAAVIFAHLGTALAKRAEKPVQKHQRRVIWFTLAFVAILAAMPWGSPLFPGL